jgi:hypothetical protein
MQKAYQCLYCSVTYYSDANGIPLFEGHSSKEYGLSDQGIAQRLLDRGRARTTIDNEHDSYHILFKSVRRTDILQYYRQFAQGSIVGVHYGSVAPPPSHGLETEDPSSIREY